jgi:site-specific DNA recombinase
MIKRAAIYIRVSTERQAEKASPHEQEKACRAYCEQHGYTVVEVYKDVEKYKVGRRTVEPSGTRADRPQLRRMLADADKGQFEVIIAWREDRLYRGLRPMLEVIECTERNKVAIELVTETFDSKMAPIKAAIARMELDSIKERHALGRAGRLALGKVQPGHVAYGYKSVEGYPEVEPSEVEWIRRIFAWYADGIGLREIRHKMILGGAPQRQTNNFGQGKVRVDWAITIIQRLLGYETYWTGKQFIKTRNEKVFEIEYPILIDAVTAERAKKRRLRNKSCRVHHIKYPFLVSGIAYCQNCGVKLQAKSRLRSYSKLRQNKHLVLTYSCKYFDVGYQDTLKLADCCRTIAAQRLDNAVWEKVWKVLADDAFFEQLIQLKIDELKAQEADAENTTARLQTALESLTLERQRIITWARKGSISESDMELQLGGVEIEEIALKRELAEKSLLLDKRAQKLIDFLARYRSELREGIELLAKEPPSPELAEKQFVLRKATVNAIVTRVEVLPDKSPKVYFVFDLDEAAGNTGSIKPSPVG